MCELRDPQQKVASTAVWHVYPYTLAYSPSAPLNPRMTIVPYSALVLPLLAVSITESRRLNTCAIFPSRYLDAHNTGTGEFYHGNTALVPVIP